MPVPTMGLCEGDPRQLGGYRLLGRLSESRLGVVYLGRDGSGRRVSVAMLNDAGGIDESTRERFAHEVERGSDVVAARTSGRSALWVACPYQEGAQDSAGAFLERAGQGGRLVRSGPAVLPYWAGERGVSAVRWSPRTGGRESAVARGETNWWLIGALGALLALLLVLMFALYLWMLRFPPPEPPPTEEQAEQGEPSADPSQGEGEQDSPTVPTVPGPGPGPGPEGDQEWEEQPEDNL